MDSFLTFLSSVWGIILLCLIVFYSIVAALVPFFIYSINQKLDQTNKALAALLAKNPPPFPVDDQKEMARDMAAMRRIMTGETTPEAEQQRAKEREELKAQRDEQRAQDAKKFQFRQS